MADTFARRLADVGREYDAILARLRVLWRRL